MEFKFGTVSISEIGEFVSNKLREDGVNGNSEFIVTLDENEFKRVDEDLFYRMREDEKEEFIPSEGEIIINFDNVKIIIKNKNVEE